MHANRVSRGARRAGASMLEFLLQPVNVTLGIWTVIGGPVITAVAYHRLAERGSSFGTIPVAIAVLIGSTVAMLTVSYGFWSMTGLPRLWYVIVRHL